jgi:hypothetical protein
MSATRKSNDRRTETRKHRAERRLRQQVRAASRTFKVRHARQVTEG